jgi:hypothetical protein
LSRPIDARVRWRPSCCGPSVRRALVLFAVLAALVISSVGARGYLWLLGVWSARSVWLNRLILYLSLPLLAWLSDQLFLWGWAG